MKAELRKKHFVSLAIALHEVFRLVSASNRHRLARVGDVTDAVEAAVSTWCKGQSPETFNADAFREVIRTGKEAKA